jgi:hypothetical protein
MPMRIDQDNGSRFFAVVFETRDRGGSGNSAAASKARTALDKLLRLFIKRDPETSDLPSILSPTTEAIPDKFRRIAHMLCKLWQSLSNYCMIVRQSPFHLGSGWLSLWAPAQVDSVLLIAFSSFSPGTMMLGAEPLATGAAFVRRAFSGAEFASFFWQSANGAVVWFASKPPDSVFSVAAALDGFALHLSLHSY